MSWFIENNTCPLCRYEFPQEPAPAPNTPILGPPMEPATGPLDTDHTPIGPPIGPAEANVPDMEGLLQRIEEMIREQFSDNNIQTQGVMPPRPIMTERMIDIMEEDQLQQAIYLSMGPPEGQPPESEAGAEAEDEAEDEAEAEAKDEDEQSLPDDEEEDDDGDNPLSDEEKQEAASLINAIRALEISETTKEELKEYEQDIKDGEFEQMDIRYLRALKARLKA